MINVYMEGYKYTNDFYELIHVFYLNEDIEQIENVGEYDNGYLININLNNLGKGPTAICKVYFNKRLISEAKEQIDTIFINRPLEKTIRIGIKKVIYNALTSIVDKNLPWGILTGIRPTKIVHELIEKNTSESTILEILTKEYMINNDNAKLLMNIAYKQSKHLYPIDSNRYSLYIGIPFCPTRCLYCSFPTLPIGRYSNLVSKYIDTLIYEITEIKTLMKGKKINSVYIGGGTPTSISVEDLRKIINTVYDSFGKENIREFTIEAGRPDTINYELLNMLKEEQIERISVNPQTMNDRTLKLIGRKHTSEDIINSYKMAKEVGISSVNMDLIVGLPGEGVADIKNSLETIGKLNPENLTIHTLSVKRGSKFIEHLDEYDIEGQSVIERMLYETKSFAQSMNLEPYYLYRQKNILGNFENIGYAKKDYECIYNISIMEEKESILAAGVGSTSKIYYPEENRLERIFNFRDLKEYLNRIDELIERKRKILI